MCHNEMQIAPSWRLDPLKSAWEQRRQRTMMELHVCDRKGSMIKAFALGDRQELIVGRDETCDIQIRSRSVSREHCSIEAEDGEMFLRDLGSTSGTFANGERVEKIRLEDGLQIEVGPAVLKFFDAGI